MKIHSYPESEARNQSISIRLNGGEVIHPCTTRVSAIPFNTPWNGFQRPLDQTEEADFLSFTMQPGETVEVSVVFQKPFRKASVHPLSRNIRCTGNKNTVSFSLPGPGQYNLQLDGIHRNLYLFADRPVNENPRATYYYAKGIHHPGIVELHSNESVFLEDGAVVYGAFYAINAENIQITGHGILDGSFEERTDDTACIFNTIHLPSDPKKDLLQHPEEIRPAMEEMKLLMGALKFMNCKNIHIEGPILRDVCTFNLAPARCEHIVIDGVKTIGMYKYNTDGFDLINCSDAVIRNCFLRNFDDCIVIKGCYGWGNKLNENILIENCVVWCDWGGNLEIGAETRAAEFRNITYRNCDLIFGSYFMRIQNRGSAYVHDIVYENISCEIPAEATLPRLIQDDPEQKYDCTARPADPVYLMLFSSAFSDIYQHETQPGRINRVSCKNITVYADEGIRPILNFYGGDGVHPGSYTFDPDAIGGPTENVSVENVTIGGKKADLQKDFEIQTGNFSTVEFR